MRVIIQPNYEKLSEWAAAYVVDKINKFNPTAEHPFVLGLPTGSSPIGMYQNLVKAYKEGLVSFKVTTLLWRKTCSTTLIVQKRTYTF